MKYSIRDFMWIMLAVGLAFGWYVDRRALKCDRDLVSQKLTKLEERIGVDFTIDFDNIPDHETDRTYFEPVEEKLANIKAAMVEFREQLATDQVPVGLQVLEIVEEDGGRLPNNSPEDSTGFDCDASLP